MVSEERTKLIQFLAKNGINAYAFSDAEIRQKAQKILSEQKMKKSGIRKMEGLRKKKENKKEGSSLAIKKLPENKKY